MTVKCLLNQPVKEKLYIQIKSAVQKKFGIKFKKKFVNDMDKRQDSIVAENLPVFNKTF